MGEGEPPENQIPETKQKSRGNDYGGKERKTKAKEESGIPSRSNTDN